MKSCWCYSFYETCAAMDSCVCVVQGSLQREAFFTTLLGWGVNAVGNLMRQGCLRGVRLGHEFHSLQHYLRTFQAFMLEELGAQLASVPPTTPSAVVSSAGGANQPLQEL